jgi:hypothetical protein
MKYENGKWISTLKAGEQVLWYKTYCPKPVQCEVIAAKVTKDGQGSERVRIRVTADCKDEISGTIFAHKETIEWIDGVNIRRNAKQGLAGDGKHHYV